MTIDLTPTERKALRARAHALSPIVMVGEAGVSPAVLNAINQALRHHDLIKIRVLAGARAQRDQLLGDICAALAAAPVQHIGKMLVIYRPLPEAEATAARSPAAPRRKPPRRTKRSYQR